MTPSEPTQKPRQFWIKLADNATEDIIFKSPNAAEMDVIHVIEYYAYEHYKKLWEEFVSLQHGDVISVFKNVERLEMALKTAKEIMKEVANSSDCPGHLCVALDMANKRIKSIEEGLT